MNNTWKIFTRDLGRLARVRQVWVILIGVMITPALYSWVNIAAFWDPYGNTGNIQVALVNEDRGGSSPMTGSLNIGKQVTDELKDNKELGWQFMSKAEADDALRRGDVYSSIEIPKTFTKDLLSTFEGTYSQPTVIYRPNEKLSAVAPKITNAGASSINEQITNSFKEQVGATAAKKLREQSNTLSGRLGNGQNKAITGLEETIATLEKSQGSLEEMKGKIAGARPTIAAAQDALNSANATLGSAADTLQEAQNSITTVQGIVADFSNTASQAYAQGTTALAEGTAAAESSIAAISTAVEQSGRQLAGASKQATQLTDLADNSVAQLRSILGGAALGPGVAANLNGAIDQLEESSNANRKLLEDLNAAGDSTANTARTLRESSKELSAAAAAAQESAKGMNTTTGDTLPRLNAAMNRLATTAGTFSGTLSSQQTLLREAGDVLTGLDQQVGATMGVIDDFSDTLHGVQEGVEGARTDLLALNIGNIDVLKTAQNLDSESFGQFMATPAELKNESVYPVNSYGSGMSAMFTNLTLWIGAFMMVVIFRVEVDTEGLGKNGARRVSVAQAFWGRLLLLGSVVLGQALIVSIGNLLIGVQTVNPLVYIATNMLVGLSYLGVIYGLVSALGHIGRGMAVGLAFIQIPGASGLYPIEMTPQFFKFIHPMLPMTYGIDAVRETIGGFYGTHYWQALGALALFAAVFLLLGMTARRKLSHVNLLFNKQLARSGLLTSDNVQVVGSGYRMADVIHAMNNHEQFAEDSEQRTADLLAASPKKINRTLAIGAVALLVLGVLSATTDIERVAIFGAAVALVIAIIFIIGQMEYSRLSHIKAQELSTLDSQQLQRVAASQAAGSKAYTLSGPEPEDGAGAGSGNHSGSAKNVDEEEAPTKTWDARTSEEGQK